MPAFPSETPVELYLPVVGSIVTQGYGPEQTDPGVRHLYRKGYHTGIDFSGAVEGTPVLSPTAGTVVLAGTNGGYGECVVVSRDDGIEALFGHLCRIDVQLGERVSIGQAIGGIGDTGVSTGVHLHLEYRQDGQDIDPGPFLQIGPAAAPPPGWTAQTLMYANVRERPSEDAAVLGVVPAAAAVALRRGAYYPVRWQGRDGWIWGEYLELRTDEAAAPAEAMTPAAEQPPAPPSVLFERWRGHTTSDLNLREGPGLAYAVLSALPPGTGVDVQDEQDEWLQVHAAGRAGYVHRNFVAREGLPTAHGFFKERRELATLPLAPALSEQIVAAATTNTEQLVAETWNRYGGILTVLSRELRIDPATALAVLAIEAGGRAFAADGRMIIRFENHIFYDLWGKHAAAAFAGHFSFSADQTWQDHLWRPSPAEPWRAFHGDQAAEWQIFQLACGFDDTAAKCAISMGAPQIMGFNHTAIGYASVQEMFEAFSRSEQAQIIGFFDFVQGASADSPRVLALQRQDFIAFASLYNGSGQAATYAGLMENVFNAFQRLRSA